MKTNIRKLAILAGVALICFLAAQLGFAMRFAGPHVTPIWPPTGLALAVLLLFGHRVWPGILTGAFAASLTAPLLAGMAPASLVFAAAGIAAACTLEAMLGAGLVEEFAGGSRAFEQPQTIGRFVALAGIASALGPALAFCCLALAGVYSWRNFGTLWPQWWLGHLVSAVVVTPLLLVWSAASDLRPELRGEFRPGFNLAEFVALPVSLILLFGVIFWDWFSLSTGAPLSFLVIPVLLWTALRFGQQGTATSILVLAGFAISGTAHGLGPFALANRNMSQFTLQAFLGIFTLMAFMLAADAGQRRRAENALRASEHRYRELFESNPHPAWVFDYETLRFLAVNQAAVDCYGYSREEFMGMRVTDIRPAEEANAVLESVARERSGQPVPPARRHQKKDGTVIDVEVTRHNLLFDERPAALVLSTDVTERKRAENRAAALSDLGQRLGAARSPKQAAQIIVNAADVLFGWDACLFDLCLPDQWHLSTVLAVDTIDGRRTELPPLSQHAGPLARSAIERGGHLLLRSAHDSFPAEAIPFGDKSRPSASLMTVPVRKEDQIVGILSIQSYTHQAYTEEDLRTLQALADHCGGALHRIRSEEEIERLNSELRRHLDELVRLNAELEQRVRTRTGQLEAANQELEAFSYSVSHDLRAPLRSIRGFSEVVLERYASQLDDRGRDFLKRACESCYHMDKLIDNLLQLSRVGRSELQQREVNLSALAEAVAAELCKSEPKRDVTLNLAPDLQAVGDERLLRLVLDNLLRNAWKFTRGQPHPQIEFGFVSEPQPAYFIRDNGAGFDMAFSGRLFGVFQRLHSTTDFPGTGVGLAIVQRIIKRHGGRVWAIGAVNQGATFFFTLPHAQSHCSANHDYESASQGVNR